ncbi:hypothetical protein ACHAQI_012241 [Fusarium lateritium]
MLGSMTLFQTTGILTLSIEIGEIAAKIFESPDVSNYEKVAGDVQKHYLDQCEQVNNANPYFWEALVTGELPSSPKSYGSGSIDEARRVLHYCRQAWDESGDTLAVVEADTGRYVRVHEGPKPDEKRLFLERRRGTEVAFPSKIKYSDATRLLQRVRVDNSSGRSALGRRRELLLYTAGVYSSGGHRNGRGGWAVWLANTLPGATKVVSGRLEDEGPFGHASPTSSTRAALRAVVVALRLSDWKEKGFDTIVIATDAFHVVEDATDRLKGWGRTKWKQHTGEKVPNEDLWEMLFGEVERWRTARNLPDTAQLTGITLNFTQIPSPSGAQQIYRLAICLAGESPFLDEYGNYIKEMGSNRHLTPAYTPESALSILNGPSPISMILIADAAIARHREVWERIIDHMRNGARVVMAGSFSSTVTTGEFQRLLTIAGLPWKKASCYRADISLQPGIVDEYLTNRIHYYDFYGKFAFIEGVEKDAAWYINQDSHAEAAIALTKFGLGRLGYIGSVDVDEPSVVIACAMFGR